MNFQANSSENVKCSIDENMFPNELMKKCESNHKRCYFLYFVQGAIKPYHLMFQSKLMSRFYFESQNVGVWLLSLDLGLFYMKYFNMYTASRFLLRLTSHQKEYLKWRWFLLSLSVSSHCFNSSCKTF